MLQLLSGKSCGYFSSVSSWTFWLDQFYDNGGASRIITSVERTYMATYVVGCFEDHFTTQRAYGLLQPMISVQKCSLHSWSYPPLQLLASHSNNNSSIKYSNKQSHIRIINQTLEAARNWQNDLLVSTSPSGLRNTYVPTFCSSPDSISDEDSWLLEFLPQIEWHGITCIGRFVGCLKYCGNNVPVFMCTFFRLRDCSK